MICMTLDCVRPTQFSVIQTIHGNVGLKCFFKNFTKIFIIVMHLSLIFHKVVQRYIYGVVKNVLITLLQIVCRVCR